MAILSKELEPYIGRTDEQGNSCALISHPGRKIYITNYLLSEGQQGDGSLIQVRYWYWSWSWWSNTVSHSDKWGYQCRYIPWGQDKEGQDKEAKKWYPMEYEECNHSHSDVLQSITTNMLAIL